jgi:hypothetical protein
LEKEKVALVQEVETLKLNETRAARNTALLEEEKNQSLEVANSLKATIERLSNNIESAAANIDGLDKEKKLLKEESKANEESAARIIASLEQEKKQLLDEIAKAKEDTAMVASMMSTFESEKLELLRGSSASELDEESVKRNIALLEEEKRKLLDEIERASEKVNITVSKLSAVEIEKEGFAASIGKDAANISEEIEKLRQQMDDDQEKIAISLSNINSLQSKNSALAQEIEESEGKEARTGKMIATLEQEKNKMMEEIETIKVELEAALNNISALESEKAVLLQQIGASKANEVKFAKAVASLEEQRNDFIKNINALNQAVDSRTADIDSLEREKTALLAELKKSIYYDEESISTNEVNESQEEGTENPLDGARVIFQAVALERLTTYQSTIELRPSPLSRQNRKTWFGIGKEPSDDIDLSFTYDFDELVVGNDSTSAPTTAVMLIHPIGVGIGRWYYDRLMLALDEKYGGGDRRYVFISPDLLGSGSACSPIIESGEEIKKLPLLTIRDWSEQLEELMADYEAKSTSEGHVVENWCVVANGGCSPIALKVAEHAAELTVPFEGKVTNVVLSSPPRLPFFLEGTDSAEVQKSYRTLCGPAGKLFWWNALRKVHEFSERNLVGNPESLGEAWTPNCVATGKLDGGRSRYSTFAFLAGTLQEGCQASLDVLRGKDVKIDFIRGKDKRKNKARSGLSEEGMKLQDEVTLSKGNGDSVDTVGQLVAATEALSPTGEEEETIQDYVKRNGNSGKTKWVGGRISLAHEDGEGYATALMEHIS